MSKGAIIDMNFGNLGPGMGAGGAPFDVLAADYDRIFSHSLTGLAQRLVCRERLKAFLAGKGPLRILEINCGTGEDAYWLASLGHEVIATDQSAAMIHVAREKGGGGAGAEDRVAVRFIQCGFGELGKEFQGQSFDLIFSNFAGLNCVTPGDLPGLGTQFCNLLKEDGHLAIVIFGKHCWWETCYYLLKGDARNAFRRWSDRGSVARLGPDAEQRVYYYSTGWLVEMWRSFRLLEKRPVGLFVPPSFMEGAMQRNPRWFRWLVKLERRTRNFSAGSALADHTYMLFKKELI
jgi:ubiquinone/menaquinone biosynthesis C-methylase UbiE